MFRRGEGWKGEGISSVIGEGSEAAACVGEVREGMVRARAALLAREVRKREAAACVEEVRASMMYAALSVASLPLGAGGKDIINLGIVGEVANTALLAASSPIVGEVRERRGEMVSSIDGRGGEMGLSLAYSASLPVGGEVREG